MNQENEECDIEYNEEEIYNLLDYQENKDNIDLLQNEININSLDYYLNNFHNQNVEEEKELDVSDIHGNQGQDQQNQKNNRDHTDNFFLFSNDTTHNNIPSIQPTPCIKCKPKFTKCQICNGYFKFNILHEIHLPKCQKIHKTYEVSVGLIICQDCNLYIKCEEFQNHMQKCSSFNFQNQNIKCKYCNVEFALHLIEEHELACESLLTNLLLMKEKAECSICKEQVPYFELETHESHCLKLKAEKDKIESQLLTCRSYPNNWEKNNLQSEKISNDLELVPLNINTDEYKEVENLFNLTLKDQNIISIKRIQNSFLWEKYNLEKTRIEKEKGFVEEKLIFFANQQIKAEYTYKNGFDISFAVDNHPYGRGIYFYTRADKLLSQFQILESKPSSKVIFLANVLVGIAYVSEQQNPQLRKPPYYDKEKFIYYDSVTNLENFSGDKLTDQLYVVYSNDKAYPSYMIEFTNQIRNNNSMILEI